MASPPFWLLPFLGGGAGLLEGYGSEKKRQREEKAKQEEQAQHARNAAALQTMEYSQLSPALQGELYEFLSRKPEEQAQGNTELISQLAGLNPTYGPEAAKANRTLGKDTGETGMGIPAFLGNPILRGAAVASMADQVQRSRAGMGAGNKEPKAFSVASAVRRGLGLGPMQDLNAKYLGEMSPAIKAAAVDNVISEMKQINRTPSHGDLGMALSMVGMSPGEYKQLTRYR